MHRGILQVESRSAAQNGIGGRTPEAMLFQLLDSMKSG